MSTLVSCAKCKLLRPPLTNKNCCVGCLASTGVGLEALDLIEQANATIDLQSNRLGDGVENAYRDVPE